MTPNIVRVGIRVLGSFRLGFETLDERVGLVTGELAPGLALREPERAARIAKIDVSRRVDEVRELLHLTIGRRRTRRLSECHGQHCSSRV